MNDFPLQISTSVQHALDNHLPIVALESTIIAHGMPYPQNLQTALLLESTVSSHGAVPATIAIIEGVFHIGLERPQLECVAMSAQNTSTDDQKFIKASARDIPWVMATRRSAATTVSATLVGCSLVGIRVFATGGIGGVHFDVASGLDISADLPQMSRLGMSNRNEGASVRPSAGGGGVCVVCAGVKSILDIPKTLELLETLSVPVLTYRDPRFPAFYTRDSGVRSPYTVESTLQVAQLLQAQRALAILSNGAAGGASTTLLAVPVPPQFEADAKRIQGAITQALKEATEARPKIQGKDITPFLLKRVSELTDGMSLQVNIKLVQNNAVIAAQVAVDLARLTEYERNQSLVLSPKPLSHSVDTFPHQVPVKSPSFDPSSSSSAVAIIGACAVDLYCSPMEQASSLVLGSSNPGAVKLSFGGVARNIATCMSRLGSRPDLISAIGGDDFGTALIQDLELSGINVSHMIRTSQYSTATYVAVHDPSGDLYVALADMNIMEAGLISHQVVGVVPDARTKSDRGSWAQADVVSSSGDVWMKTVLDGKKWVVLDCNLLNEELALICKICKGAERQIKVWIEPTSTVKARRIVRSKVLALLDWISPNESELEAIYRELTQDNSGPASVETMIGAVLQHGCPHILVTLGSRGCILGTRTMTSVTGCPRDDISAVSDISIIHIPVPTPVPQVIHTTGAGDTLVGAVLHRLITDHASALEAVRFGMAAAALSVMSEESVPKDMSVEKVMGVLGKSGQPRSKL